MVSDLYCLHECDLDLNDDFFQGQIIIAEIEAKMI